ncbi:START-like domain-containing protein [Belliella kenyensis]|uniref:START-like domain-containing protein n=1 Tax=Belliella kenyensis TaxID=1472724 RepID=A0ABV8EM02_9BACT|nr:START-like domain-containing protein [Belliella kenyensis]MCH7400441.1 START-like domain-containing protein [Belliella kenyensis]MDN3604543.1 START-like domain-containing protein [Belliella kenyensis]
MVKNKFVADYQINTSKKILYPYLSSASGLSEWFADDVRITEDKVFVFNYDGEDHYARVVAQRLNMHVKFDFFDPEIEDESDHSFIEFKIEENELTQTLFLKVIDYSDSYDDEESESIWESLIMNLKEIIGG